MEVAREYLSYDSETGEISWLKQGSGVMRGMIAGTVTNRGYRRIKLEGRQFLAHRLAWALYFNEQPSSFIDHINGLRDDNRIINLRVVTRSQNNTNSAIRKDSKTGVKGVRFMKRENKYAAIIKVNGRSEYIGYFDLLHDAAIAYANRAKEIHGGFYRG